MAILWTGTAKGWCLTGGSVLKSESQERDVGTSMDLKYISMCTHVLKLY